MANIITAGNSTNGGTQINTDTSGTLDIKTGTGSGTTAISIDASQAVVMPGNLTVSGTLTAGAVTNTTGSFSGNLSFNSGYGSAAIAYGCRAWVNFNGTGTVAIRASGNVTSITDNGVGNYAINFTTAMPDANYNATCMGSTDTATSGQMPCVWTVDSTQTTSVFQVRTGRPSIPGVILQGLTDLVNINVAIFR